MCAARKFGYLPNPTHSEYIELVESGGRGSHDGDRLVPIWITFEDKLGDESSGTASITFWAVAEVIFPID
jgi:hypothetical protein